MIRSLSLLSLLCLIPFCLAGQNIPTSGLVVHYPFDGDSLDTSGNNLNPSVHGSPTLCPDRKGYANSAYFFDGIDDYFYIEDDPLLRPEHYTISAWYCHTGINQYARILEKRYLNTTSPYTSFLLQSNRDSNTAHTQLTTNTGRLLVDSSGPAPIGEWNLLTATFDGDSLRLYLNGVLDTALPKTGNITYSGLPLFIGICHHGGAQTYTFDGAIDEVLLYNRALSAAEIWGIFYDVPAPEEVILTVSESGTSLTWNVVDDATSYKVFSVSRPDAAFPDDWTLEQGGLTECGWTDTAPDAARKFYVVTAQSE